MPDAKFELYRSLLIKKKLKGLDDLYFFNKYIIEDNLPERQKFLVPHVHEQWASWFAGSQSRIRLLLVPRSTFKTSFFTIGWTLQQIANNKNIRILIANATLANAQRMVGEIKEHVQKNETFKLLYGDMYDKRLKWNEDELVVKGRDRGIREATVTAVGVGGNLVSQHYDCLLPGTLVFTSNGYLPVEKIRKAHRVLSSDGKFHSVVTVKEKESDKKRIGILPQYQPQMSWFTEDHRILVWRDEKINWVTAGELKKSDMLVLPRCRAKNRQASKVNGRINRLLAKEDIWRLIGYWLAEGCRTPDGGQIRMTFSDKEIGYVKDIEKIVSENLGKQISYRKTKSSTYIICFSDRDFKEILKKFGSCALDKHLPPFALNNDANKQRELIKGYFSGDGCLHKNVVSFSSISLNLLTGIQLLLSKFGISSGISQSRKAGRSVIIGNLCNVHESWNLTSAHPLLKVLLGLPAKINIKPLRSFFTKKYWIVPIRKIEKKGKAGIVYDIQVKNIHNFYCPGVLAHNCIIADDLVNSENSATRYQADKVVDWWRKSLSLLEPMGTNLIIGTRWSYYELYSYLLDEMSDKIDSYVRGAYNPDNSFYFPERFSEEKLIELKELHGSYIFSSFYLNNPVDEDTALIKKSMIKYYQKAPENLEIFTCIDPAISQRTSADFTAILTVGIDYQNNWYVLEARRGKWTVGRMIDEVFSVYERWKPITMSIEVVGQAQALLDPINAEEEKLNIFLPLTEIKARPPIRKENRIRATLQPRFENGKIFIRRSMTDLEEELIHFPKSKHDDLIESLADVSEIGFAPGKEERKEPEPESKLVRKLRAHFNKKKVYIDPVLGENI